VLVIGASNDGKVGRSVTGDVGWVAESPALSRLGLGVSIRGVGFLFCLAAEAFRLRWVTRKSRNAAPPKFRSKIKIHGNATVGA
jgi:hypothetical protein